MMIGLSLLNRMEKILRCFNEKYISLYVWIAEKLLTVIEAQIEIRKKAWTLLSLKMVGLENDMDELEKTQEVYRKRIEALKM